MIIKNENCRMCRREDACAGAIFKPDGSDEDGHDGKGIRARWSKSRPGINLSPGAHRDRQALRTSPRVGVMRRGVS